MPVLISEECTDSALKAAAGIPCAAELPPRIRLRPILCQWRWTKTTPICFFFVCGNKKNNYLTLSRDGGKTLENKPLPCPVHGNEAGRSTGERLAYKNGVLWFASQSAGLFTSSDMGEEWESVSVNGEKNLTFIRISPDGSIMLAGTDGEVNSPDGRKKGAYPLFFSGFRQKLYPC